MNLLRRRRTMTFQNEEQDIFGHGDDVARPNTISITTDVVDLMSFTIMLLIIYK